MMVTFVSQCQKKALNRTRRVLDAFANRIGDNTWQTVITEDGLITVKSLLRKTASKNTAVSCHWIRSRSRSELVWIVGYRLSFNAQGIVPVNITNKEVFMDTPSEKANPNMLYANTQLQTLVEHLFAVGYVAEQLYRRLLPTQEKQSAATFVAGCLHDLGKIDPCFQEWVRDPKKKNSIVEDGQHIDNSKFSFEKHPRHNEISVLLYKLLDHVALKNVNHNNKKSIKHAIYWHHAKPFRKEKDFITYGDIYRKLSNNIKEEGFSELLKKSIQMLKDLCIFDIRYRSTDRSILSEIFNEQIDLDILTDCNKLPLPVYKEYDRHENIEKYTTDIKHNADNNIMRSCVISADRWVSSLSRIELHKHIENCTLNSLVGDKFLEQTSLCSHIEMCLSNFSATERTLKQSEIAKNLAKTEEGVVVLSGPAGCGKTKIALEWAKLKNVQQILWICPRVQICQGLFYELTSERYLPDANVEIHTGEFKYTKQWGKLTAEEGYFSGDIVLTTIDQVLNSITTHNRADELINFLNSHVVFDEFHEYIHMPAFNLFFAELVHCKKRQQTLGNTLLVSATPHYFYLGKILEIDSVDVVEMPSFNSSRYQIEFKVFDETKYGENPLYQSHNSNAIVISNMALTAQRSFILNQHENAVLLHSKFKKSDKNKWFSEVYDSFQEQGTRKFDVLRSGPIVQASLNITCDYMVAEISNAEDCLQRLGRLDRFGVNQETNMYCIPVPKSIHEGKGSSSATKFLSKRHSLGSTRAWYGFLHTEIRDEIFRLPKIYEVYKKFHESDNNRKFIESDLIAAFKASVNLIEQKVMDPITIQTKRDKEKNRIKISKNSLRGDNRFVQMAICDLSDPKYPKFPEQYSYTEPVNERDDIDNLTATIGEIEGYGDSNKNLLAYMKNKHHNIKGGLAAYKDFILLNEARDQEFPIYLSYTPNDLIQVGGETARHSYAIYYAVCERQPIGAISIAKLTLNEDEE